MALIKAVIENLAERVAASKGGVVTLNDLMPYLPVSLDILEQHMNEMIDETIVYSERRDGLLVYVFQELLDADPQPLLDGVCVYSGKEFSASAQQVISPETEWQMREELLAQANANAWPAEAVWQHEILFIASGARRHVGVAEIAGRSRLMFKQVKERLIDLAKRGA